MEKLIFSDTAHIYRTKLNMSEYKSELLEICNRIIEKQPDVKTDGFGYNHTSGNVNFIGEVEINNKLDEIIQKGIDSCIEIYNDEFGEHNIVETSGWVNVVRAKEPVQPNFKEGQEKYHVHTEISKQYNYFVPTYTYVYYIQMPDNLKNDDGVLYFKDKNDIEYFILPEEDDLIIMPADIPHAPNKADNTTKDRIVFAGNVGLKFIKKQKSLI